MRYILELGGVCLELLCEKELPAETALCPFLLPDSVKPDFTVEISWNWEKAKLPSSQPIGRDLLQDYFFEPPFWFCQTRGGPKGPVASCRYNESFSEFICTINARPFLEPPDSLGKVLRLLPLRAVFLASRTLFLHAAQIAVSGKGILFSAPSGTGKTTQALLWQQWENARLICNDRTLLRKQDVWKSYGYPIDGSTPAGCNEVLNLGAVTLLRQSAQNRVSRLSAGRMAALLLEQTVIDSWNPDAKGKALQLIFDLMEDIPVYLLECTPEKEATEVLKKQLLRDGVI